MVGTGTYSHPLSPPSRVEQPSGMERRCTQPLCSAGHLFSSATVFFSHTTPVISSSSSHPNSIFLSHHSSSRLQLQPAERSESLFSFYALFLVFTIGWGQWALVFLDIRSGSAMAGQWNEPKFTPFLRERQMHLFYTNITRCSSPIKEVTVKGVQKFI